MPANEPHTPLSLLDGAAAGDAAAADRLLPLVYDQLRELAGRYLRRMPGQVMLQPTALVHEAYLKLIGPDPVDVRSRTHFCAMAARAMRQVLVDQHRWEGRDKRGGGRQRITLSGLEAVLDGATADAEQLEEALVELARVDERAARVVLLRFYGGMGTQAVADTLAVTDRTVRNDLRMAKAWLRCRLEGESLRGQS